MLVWLPVYGSRHLFGRLFDRLLMALTSLPYYVTIYTAQSTLFGHTIFSSSTATHLAGHRSEGV